MQQYRAVAFFVLLQIDFQSHRAVQLSETRELQIHYTYYMEHSGERTSVEAEGEAVARRTERCEHCEKCCYATKKEICLDLKSLQIFHRAQKCVCLEDIHFRTIGNLNSKLLQSKDWTHLLF